MDHPNPDFSRGPAPLTPRTHRRHSRRIAVSLATALLVLAAGLARAADDIAWSYSGERGPEHWAELSPSYRICGIGKNQSPIDILQSVEATLRPLEIDYRSRAHTLVNNGHTLEIEVEPGSQLRVEAEDFELKQFHMHSPSEHRIRGEAFPLEAHFVHANAAGQLAVVSVLFRRGEWNAQLASIGAAAPPAGEEAPISFALSELNLLPTTRAYYRYGGSLTTPPCSEGVRWFVLQEQGTVAAEQVEAFIALIGADARGPQPLNGRLILH